MLPEQAAVQHLQSGKSRQNINILLFGVSLIFSINTGKIKVDKNTTFSDVRKNKVPFQSIFRFDTSLALLLITLCLKENEDSKDYKWTNIGSDYSGDKSDDGARVAKCSVFFQK